jgi:hypothetical protein
LLDVFEQTQPREGAVIAETLKNQAAPELKWIARQPLYDSML